MHILQIKPSWRFFRNGETALLALWSAATVDLYGPSKLIKLKIRGVEWPFP